MRNIVVATLAGLTLVACESEAEPNQTAPVEETTEDGTADAGGVESEISEDAESSEGAETETTEDSETVEAPTIAARPVRYGFDGPDLDACGGYGEVSGLKAGGDGFLSVREAPDVKAKELDRLTAGQGVTFCDSAKGNSWIGVVYDKSGGKDCGTGSPIDATKNYPGPCQSGWVSAKYVTLIAG